jgi:hypothetical protein
MIDAGISNFWGSPLSVPPDEPGCAEEYSYDRRDDENPEGDVRRRYGGELGGWYTWRWVGACNDEVRSPTNEHRCDDAPPRDIQHVYVSPAERHETELSIAGDGNRLW